MIVVWYLSHAVQCGQKAQQHQRTSQYGKDHRQDTDSLVPHWNIFIVVIPDTTILVDAGMQHQLIWVRLSDVWVHHRAIAARLPHYHPILLRGIGNTAVVRTSSATLWLSCIHHYCATGAFPHYHPFLLWGIGNTVVRTSSAGILRLTCVCSIAAAAAAAADGDTGNIMLLIIVFGCVSSAPILAPRKHCDINFGSLFVHVHVRCAACIYRELILCGGNVPNLLRMRNN